MRFEAPRKRFRSAWEWRQWSRGARYSPTECAWNERNPLGLHPLPTFGTRTNSFHNPSVANPVTARITDHSPPISDHRRLDQSLVTLVTFHQRSCAATFGPLSSGLRGSESGPSCRCPITVLLLDTLRLFHSYGHDIARRSARSTLSVPSTEPKGPTTGQEAEISTESMVIAHTAVRQLTLYQCALSTLQDDVLWRATVSPMCGCRAPLLATR